ncbi:hypothetical protein Q9233_005578 [Columba guinea]|nr:hypothetical protein Q9233_005578 [Columba guinea]
MLDEYLGRHLKINEMHPILGALVFPESVSDVPMPPSQTASQKAPQTVRQTAHRPSQEETEQHQELCKLLTAKDFQTRMEGVMLLLDHCKNNPQLISTNISQHRVARDVKSARRLREPVAPLPSLPPRQAKETSHRVRPRLLSVDDFKISNEKSILTIEMKKQQRFLNEDGDGIGRKPNAIPPLDDWASEADVQDFSTGQGGDHPHLSHQALTQDPQEREASSADSGTIQIKDKLKTKRMSEGLSASYRASQKLRVTSKTMSATQNRPISSETSMLSDGEQEHGENDTDYDASDEDNMEFRGFCAASLSPMGLPRDRKAYRGNGMQNILMSSRWMPEVQTLEPILPALQHRVARDVKSARRLREPVAPLPSLPPRQAKETSHRVRPRLLSVDDFKISNEKIRVVLYESAQEKIDQQQMRERKIVLREREEETEKSLQLPALNIDPRDAANKSFGPPPVRGTVPSMSNTCKKSAGTALRKRFNRPSLPSIPVINKDSRVPCKSSVNSLPPIALDSSKAGDEPECRDAQEAKPDPNPQQALLNALTWLSSDD